MLVRPSLLLLLLSTVSSALTMGKWGTSSWNWGSAVGEAHNEAAKIRRGLQSKEARASFVQSLKQSKGSFDDAKMCLALVWQQSRKPLNPAYEEAYSKLVAGAYEGNDYAFAKTVAAGIDRYCLNVKLEPKPERLEEFLKTIKQNEAGTRTELRNLRYSWGKSTSDESYFFQEQFIEEKGFQEHAASAHFQIWEQFADTDCFVKAPTVDFWNAKTNLADEDTPSVVAAAALMTLDFVESGWS